MALSAYRTSTTWSSSLRLVSFGCSPIYHETTFLSGYTKFNSRIRSLYERLESALVAAYPQCYDVHLSSEVTKLFIAQLIDLNKHPFFKKDKVYNLNHLIKELRKR